MRWNATTEQTLTLESGEPERLAEASRALAALAAAEGIPPDLAAHLDHGLSAGILQLASLAGLAACCHGESPSREPARALSRALFAQVLPTPIPGRETDFFWRVARSIERAEPSAPPAPRAVVHRTFTSRDQAAAYAGLHAGDLLTITEVAGPSGVETTVWTWNGEG